MKRGINWCLIYLKFFLKVPKNERHIPPVAHLILAFLCGRWWPYLCASAKKIFIMAKQVWTVLIFCSRQIWINLWNECKCLASPYGRGPHSANRWTEKEPGCLHPVLSPYFIVSHPIKAQLQRKGDHRGGET